MQTVLDGIFALVGGATRSTSEVVPTVPTPPPTPARTVPPGLLEFIESADVFGLGTWDGVSYDIPTASPAGTIIVTEGHSDDRVDLSTAVRLHTELTPSEALRIARSHAHAEPSE